MSPSAGEGLGEYQRRITDICEGMLQRTRERVETFNKATKGEVKLLGEKASKLEQELKRVEDEIPCARRARSKETRGLGETE
jgi:C4-type Zn-finger protein